MLHFKLEFTVTSGFDMTSCNDIILDACDVMATSSGYKFDTCQYGKLSDSSAVGPGAGWGYLLNSCTDMIMDSCSMQQFFLNGCEISESLRITLKECVAEGNGSGNFTGGYFVGSASDSTLFVDCIAQANRVGFSIGANNAVLDGCTAVQNNVGIYIDSGATNTDLLDTCPVNNTVDNLTDLGTGTADVSHCTLMSCCERVESCCDQLNTCTLGRVITQADIPYIINTPGTYTLCSDIVYSTFIPAITIAADDVTLDLNEYGITSTDSLAISVINNDNITIRNGRLRSDTTESLFVSGCENVLVQDLQVTRSVNGLGFNITDTINSIFERCYFGEPVFPDNSTGSVFAIQGNSDGIMVKSCVIHRPRTTAFYVSVPGSGEGIVFEDCMAEQATFFGGSAGFWINGTAAAFITFKNCSAVIFQYGFLVTNTSQVLFEGCQASGCVGKF